MTFLDLCRRVARDCGVTSSLTVPADVTTQVGVLKRLVDWVADAHDEIQSRSPDWKWMRSTFSVNTVASDDTYAPTDCTDTRLAAAISRFGRWLMFDDNGCANVKIYLSSGGVGVERWLTYLPWANFRAIYKIGTQNDGVPAHFTVDPQNNLVFGPKPNDVYVVSGEYQMAGFRLAADDDEPEFPERFHLVVAYVGMQKYGMLAPAPEVFAAGVASGAPVMRQLETDQLPMIGTAGPLA